MANAVPLVRGDAAWRYELGDTAPAAWPFAIDHAMAVPGAGAKIAAMFATTTFALAAEQQGLRMLEIRLRYRDGCAVWLNGIEVARRALAGGAATHEHGAEWETLAVPVAPGLLRLGDNVLAIEVRAAGKRAVPELAVDVIGRRALGIVRGPIIAAITATTATIAVETDPDTETAIEWGDAFEHRAISPRGRHHELVLTGLPVHARVSYRVIAGAARSAPHALHTAPAAGEVVRIGVHGDVRGGHAIQRRIVDAMLGEGLDLVAVTGDMVLHGSDQADWQTFFAVAGELIAQVPYLPAIGNHDVGWGGVAFALPTPPTGRPDGAYWYSTDFADLHLVFLDSNSYERPEQEQWLDADLAAARSRHVRVILAFTHAGPYARGLHRGNAIARDRYVPILARHHVDLLLSGHDHLYQRGEAGGVRYLVTGGGGAGLYQVSCGTGGKPRCPDDGMQQVIVEHHYLVLAIDRDTIEMCPRRADGSLLEKCVRYPLNRP